MGSGLNVAVASMRVNTVERQNNLSAGRVLCAVRATCANPWSLADRSVAQSFQSEHVPLEAWPQGGARSRPRRQCSRDLLSFSGEPRSFRAFGHALRLGEPAARSIRSNGLVLFANRWGCSRNGGIAGQAAKLAHQRRSTPVRGEFRKAAGAVRSKGLWLIGRGC